MDFVSPLLDFFSIFPAWFVVLMISAVPIIELRGSIPIAIDFFGMNPAAAFILAAAGNILPIFLLFSLLEPASVFLSPKSPFFEKMFDRLLKREEKQGRQEIFRNLALALFAALPLPVTGAWIAAAAAIVLRLDLRYAFISIFAGVIAAGILVTLLTIWGVQMWGGVFNP